MADTVPTPKLTRLSPVGTRLARRLYPGTHWISVPGTTRRRLVTELSLTAEGATIFLGSEIIEAQWGDRFDAWERKKS